MKEFIEKLIGKLEGLGWVYADYYTDETAIHRQRKKSVAYDDVTSIVNELAEEHNGGWIPCSKRLPEAKKEVLIFADDNSIYVGRLLDDGFSVYDGEGWIALKHIIAWQPLPEPYQAPATEKTHKK